LILKKKKNGQVEGSITTNCLENNQSKSDINGGGAKGEAANAAAGYP
jgi:hypothetical protein